MRMHEMNEAFEKEGFDVKRDYITDKSTYAFTIRKDGVFACGEYTWHKSLSNLENNLRQGRFIENLIHTWEKEYEKSHNHPLYQLRSDLANHGGEAELIVNHKAYPIYITDVTVDSSANEVPRVSVEGEFKSLTSKDYSNYEAEMMKFVSKRVLNSIYGLPSAYTDGTGYIAAARGNGKSLLAMRQAFEMIGRSNPFAIYKVIFNGPATIVMWMDGTKTIVKCQDGDTFDPEKGLAMAISKKAFGNKGKYCDVFKKCLEDCNVHYETINTDPRAGDIYNAQQRLHNALHDTKATKRDLIAAMKEAVGYLDRTHIDQNY